jgi:hypothetical protein
MTPEMTHSVVLTYLIRGIAALGALSAAFPAFAGWEYSEAARPKTANEVPSQSNTKSTERAESLPTRVQVLGNGEVRPAPALVAPVIRTTASSDMTAADYAKMIREDARALGTPVDDSAVDSEFENFRSRIKSRKVVENETVNDADYEEAPAPRKKARPKKRAAPARRYIPPPPPMETEVITPQKANEVSSASSRGMESNAAFPYTHLLPSPYTLSQGSWVFGTSIAYGVFDFFQVSTNLTLDIQKQWNFQAKVPLVDFPTFVASVFVDYQSFNPRSYDDTNPDMRVQQWQPGIVTGYEITPDMAFFIGGNINSSKDPGKIIVTSGYMKGAQLNMEWSWLYNPESSRLGNNALSLGMKYDVTYSLFGFGLTHHWKNFDLGVHYVFADKSQFIPILGFSVGGRF